VYKIQAQHEGDECQSASNADEEENGEHYCAVDFNVIEDGGPFHVLAAGCMLPPRGDASECVECENCAVDGGGEEEVDF